MVENYLCLITNKISFSHYIQTASKAMIATTHMYNTAITIYVTVLSSNFSSSKVVKNKIPKITGLNKFGSLDKLKIFIKPWYFSLVLSKKF